MTSVSLDRIAQAFGMDAPKENDSHQYATVDSINVDGSYQVQMNGATNTTRAAKLCNAAIGDRVLCVISEGQVAAIGKVGGEFSGLGTYTEATQFTNVSVSSGATKSLCQVDLEKGTWIITGTASWSTSGNGVRVVFIHTEKDASPDDAGSFKGLQQVGGSSASYIWLSVACIVQPTSTTTYYLTTQQTSGSSLNCRAAIHAVRIG